MSEIKFKLASEFDFEILPHPVPAAKAIPSWYKNIPPMTVGDGGYKNLMTVKKCVPFLDALTTGYILPLQADIAFIINDNGDFILHPSEGKDINPVSYHNVNQLTYTPLQDKYPFCKGKDIMKWQSPWFISTPPGWSCIFTSPLNHFETRFKIIDGIVDTDSYKLIVNFPFFWTGFEVGEHIIKKGTPMVQVIPFKREELKMDVSVLTDEDKKEIDLQQGKFALDVQDHYREKHWHKRKKSDD